MIGVRIQQAGVTLVELLVAATIGSIVLGAVAQLLVVSSRHYSRAETLAAMQARADVALRFLRDDLRMAGHWGALREGSAISGRALPGNANPDALMLPSRCSAAFTTALARGVTADAGPAAWGCRVTAIPGNHAVAVRYASAEAFAAQANRLQVVGDTQSAQLTAQAATTPTSTPGLAIRDLAVRGYYVAPSSSVFPSQPVLRRMTLQALTSGPRYIDEEITPGVEALRAAVHVDLSGDGAADTILPAGHPALARVDAANVPLHPALAVSVALVVRSETARWRDTGAQQFDLLGQSVAFPADGYLRLAAVATTRVRNAGWPR